MRPIDADAAIQELCGGNKTIMWQDAIIRSIERVPTIDAVPVVHGRWEHIPFDGGDDRYGMNKYNTRIKCTACGFVTSSDFVGFNYCHSCGAKMGKEVDHA